MTTTPKTKAFLGLGIVLLLLIGAGLFFIKGRGDQTAKQEGRVTTPNASAVELTIWEHERDEIQQVLDRMNRTFEAANPGVTIKRSHYKTEDLRTQFQTAALGGGGPDIVMGPNDFGGPLSLMGIIRPVDDLIDATKFFPEVIAAVQGGGKTWGVPISRGNHLMLFVNKKLIAKAPETLEDLVKEAKRVTKGSVYGLAYNLNEPFWFVTFMSAFGTLPLTDSKPNLDNSGMIQALEFVHDLKFKDKVVPADCDYTCADTLFAEGKAAMTINGDWTVEKYKGALKDDLIIAALPKNAKNGLYMQPMVSGKFIFLNARSTGPSYEVAKKYSQFMIQDNVQAEFAKHGGRLPATRSVAESDTISKDPVLSASQAALVHGQPMPMDVGLRAVWDAIRPQLQGVMSGRTQSKLAANAMQKDAEVKIKEMKQ